MEYKIIDKKDVELWVNESITVRNNKTGVLGRLTMNIDECAESPREWDNVCKIVSRSGNWDISDKGWTMTHSEFVEYLHGLLDKKCPEIKGLTDAENIADCECVKKYILCKPVYMYDHSGQTISLTPFGDRWDSGIAGFIFCTKEDIKKNCTDVTNKNWLEIAEKVMSSEIDIYDDYIRGAVYCYCLEEAHTVEHKDLTSGNKWVTSEFEVVDSLCGFYGDNCSREILEQALGNEWCVVEPIKESF